MAAKRTLFPYVRMTKELYKTAPLRSTIYIQQSIRSGYAPTIFHISLIGIATMSVLAMHIAGRCRLIESMMGFRPKQGNLRLVFRLFVLCEACRA